MKEERRDVTDCPVSPFFFVFTIYCLGGTRHFLKFFVFFPPRYEKGRVFFPSPLPRSVDTKHATQIAGDFFHKPYRTPRLTLQWVAGIDGKRVCTSSKLCKRIDDSKIY